MIVMAHYSAPATKSFDIISQSGSKLLLNRVLKRLLESEKDAAARCKSAQNSANAR